ncbi:MAG: YqaE/Pmp3 family membrane protein [Chitinophagaceae bacterium]|nr:YqaE/Pmp3 family membrane protein [Chitinophagaceae bacterium]
MDAQTFLSLTPKKVEEMTGRKMSFKERIGLKLAQSKMKRQLKKGSAGSVPKGVYILLAIFGLAWIAMGIMDDWSGNNWWLNLILTLLFWLPGFIHALVIMNKYY